MDLISQINQKHYIKKRKDLSDSERKQIDDKFSDPNKYFELDENIIIGKEIKPKYNEELLKKMLLFSPKRNSIKFKSNYNSMIGTPTNTTSFINISKSQKKEKSVIINDKALDEIYDKYRHLKKVNKVNDFLKYIEGSAKRDMSHDLICQEKALKLKEKHDNIHKNVIQKIRDKTNKSQESILMNSIYEYRNKREIQNIIDDKIKDKNKYGSVNSWMISLRKTDIYKGDRYCYINLNNDEKPSWQLVKEKNTKEYEIIKVPNIVKSMDMTRNEYLCKSINDLGLINDQSVCFQNVDLSVFKIFNLD
jgi:hypothetical protein